jgi:hypothetical protein
MRKLLIGLVIGAAGLAVVPALARWRVAQPWRCPRAADARRHLRSVYRERLKELERSIAHVSGAQILRLLIDYRSRVLEVWEECLRAFPENPPPPKDPPVGLDPVNVAGVLCPEPGTVIALDPQVIRSPNGSVRFRADLGYRTTLLYARRVNNIYRSFGRDFGEHIRSRRANTE